MRNLMILLAIMALTTSCVLHGQKGLVTPAIDGQCNEGEFQTTRRQIEAYLAKAAEHHKKKQDKMARKYLIMAQQEIWDFQGSEKQSKILAQQFQFSMKLMGALVNLDELTPAQAQKLIIMPSEPSAADIESVEAAKSIPNIRKYVDGLSPSAKRRIAKELASFTRNKKGRALFQRYLNRSAKYRKYIYQVLAQYGLPSELFCVALIESGMSPKSRSAASAVGLWQIIAGTARIYGLQVDQWVDSRLDWEASTHAAAKYLKNSFERYNGNFELAVASYNTGPGNVDRAIARSGHHDFWRCKTHPETTRYVPKILAALLIVNDPKKYGFTIPPDAPEEVDVLTLRGSVELENIARAIGTPTEMVVALNPALLRKALPPDRAYRLRIPKGKKQQLQARLPDLIGNSSVVWIAHTAKSSDSLVSLSVNYGVSVKRILLANESLDRNEPIAAGQALMIPVSPDNKKAFAYLQKLEKKRAKKWAAMAAKNRSAGRWKNTKSVTYSVRPGDSLWLIARRFDVSVEDLKRWNKKSLGRKNSIHPGQKLYVQTKSGNRIVNVSGKYTVRPGDTLSGIAFRHGIETGKLAKLNKIDVNKTLHPGTVLKVVKSSTYDEGGKQRKVTLDKGQTISELAEKHNVSTKALLKTNNITDPTKVNAGRTIIIPGKGHVSKKSSKKGYHVVRKGETLSHIALRYKISTKDLMRWNKIKSARTIKIGQKLKVRPAKRTHNVKSGEVLSKIAEKYGVSTKALAKANNILVSSLIRVGQKLVIP